MSEPATTPAKTKEPFVYRAGILGIWALIVANMLALAVQSGMTVAPKSVAATTVVPIVYLSLVLFGLVMSVIALLAIRKRGKAKLLGRGLVGLGLSVFLLVLVATGSRVLRPGRTMEERMTGTWEWRNDVRGRSQRLELQADKHLRVEVTTPEPAELTGTWEAVAEKPEEGPGYYLVLHLDAGTGNVSKALFGQEKRFEIVDTNDKQLTVMYAGEKRTYQRVGAP